ncbi:cyclic nucleotide-binding protein [Phaeobacter gallaeciensis]|uniref:Acb2/Tad1 domain-containing protein n=1 Tax=Phaeobacter gallaeciensis TaxID=60890 RepID=UPI0023803AA7|nr:cyclic nucleotide-binding protein [Phaeobacter gallaeciensis]MDE4297115.1 cyclic nucleotide-binding protein [Phaeobacter gallaeciensis]
MPDPLPVNGYTSQSDEKVALVNENKLIEELVMRQLDRHVRNVNSSDIDQRMVALARTKTQEAFMWLNRAVFQPKRLYDADLSPLAEKLEVQP